MRPPSALVPALLLALAGVGVAAPVTVEVATPGGRSLGRMVGETRGSVTYVPLTEVGRVLGATVRIRGNTATIDVKGKRVFLRRDETTVKVAGHAVTLTAPVRAPRGRWLVPEDLVVRVLPAMLGQGVRVSPVQTGAPPAAVPPPVIAPRSAMRRAAPDGPPARAGSPVVLRGRGAGGSTDPPAGTGSSEVAPRPAERSLPVPAEAAIVAPLERPTRVAVPASGIEMRHRSYPAYTRIVLEGPEIREPRVVEQRDGLLVTLGGWTGPLPRTTRIVRDGLVGELVLDDTRGGPALHVTFEKPPGGRKVFRLTDPPRLVLDLARSAPSAGQRVAADPGGVRTIVIDPGHGGHDPGATGPGGLQEKELTLDLARRVAVLLQEDMGVRVVLTRAQDRFLALRERTALANREKADLFVSIHVNAAPGMTAAGTETYFLSSEATDNAARAAAAFENRVISLEANAGGASRDVLRSILWDLTQSDFQQESSRLAEALQIQLDRALRLPGRGVKQAPFYVLGGAAMPAVLVEVGFLSNPQEEQRLRDEGYRDRLARALAAGLSAYKRDYEHRAVGSRS